MALSVYNIKKWFLMLTGRSILHVNQDLGRYFSAAEVKGYYNNLTEKVTRLQPLLDTEDLPTSPDESGGHVLFPVAIFQYGLGAYDLYLASEKKTRVFCSNSCSVQSGRLTTRSLRELGTISSSAILSILTELWLRAREHLCC